jgi:hypothetical protein
MSTRSNLLRRLPCVALVILALVAAGCGGGSSSSKSSSSAPSSSASSSSSSGGSASGIPQGPTAGDRDADNHGGPSDGDGNL